MRGQVEYALHCAVADYLRVVLPAEVLWTTVGHGGGGPIRGAKLKRAGLRPGCADLFISWMNGFYDLHSGVTMPAGAVTEILWIELKSDKGRQSSEQMVFQRDALRVGHEYAIARSVGDVEEIIRSRGVPMRGKIAA